MMLVTVEQEMRVGDEQWRALAASVLRGARKTIDREFAKRIKRDLDEMRRTHTGKIVGKK